MCEKFAAFALACVLGVSPLQAAQRSSTTEATRSAADVSGQAIDVSGSAVPDAQVEAQQQGRVVSQTSTNAEGRYQLRLAAGAYDLVVTRDGFEPARAIVTVGARPIVRNVTLRVGAFAETTVVTASRTKEARSSTLAATTVVTDRDIEALGSRSLDDVLRLGPGLQIESVGREGSPASLFTRGGESDYNLVLIDGVRVNQVGGYYDFSRVDAADIARVEVVRGSQSALYGSDAMGSVVQIFTRRADAGARPVVGGSLAGGSLGTFRGNASARGGLGPRGDFSVNVSHRHTDGAFQDLLREKDTYDQTSANANAGVLLGSGARLRGALRYSTADGKSVGPISYNSRDTGTSYDTRDVQGDAGFDQSIGARFHHAADVSLYDNKSGSSDLIEDPTYPLYALLEGRIGALFPNGPRLVRFIDENAFNGFANNPTSLSSGQFVASAPFGISDYPFDPLVTRFRRASVRYQADLEWQPGSTLSAGYEFERERDRDNPTFERHNNALFVQQRLSFGNRWFASVGGRLDENSRYGSAFNPKLSAGGFLLPFRAGAISSLQVRSNWGKGIKNGSFGELFGSIYVDGNPDLEPERATTFDAGADVTMDGQAWRASVTYFHNDYTDQIAYKPTAFSPDGLPDYVNIAGSEAHGVELELGRQRPWHGVKVSAFYTRLATEVTESTSTSEQFQPGQPLLRRPANSGALRASYRRDRFGADALLRIVGQRHDSSFLYLSTLPTAAQPFGETVDITVNPGYHVLTLNGSYDVRPGTSLFVTVDNVEDERYDSALGYPGLPRTFLAGVRVNLPLP